MSHPYENLPPTAFWKTAVGGVPFDGISGLWSPKFRITPDTPVVTFGSCFAQHFSRRLVARGYTWINAEPPPPGMVGDEAAHQNYGIFSARTGNIYTAATLRQWIDWAAGGTPPDLAWERDDQRVVDPFRPTIAPDGYETGAAMLRARAVTIEALRRAVEQAGVFVFTMGLTEGWEDTVAGQALAACPGTAGGQFDPGRHRFVNATFVEVHADMCAVLTRLRELNPRICMLLTVSPVPLVATASGGHVLTATTYSKSVLRSVAGQLAAEHDFVDYFPSYEIVTAPAARGAFFAENLRSVTVDGVDFVMSRFFEPGYRVIAEPAAPPGAGDHSPAEDDVVCEEELLEAFATPTAAAQGPRLGLVGNSHLGALRAHFSGRAPELAGFGLSFWGLPGAFRQIEVADQHLSHPDTRKVRRVNGAGNEIFSLTGLDGFVLIAEPMAMPRYLRGINEEEPDVLSRSAAHIVDALFARAEAAKGMEILMTARGLTSGPVVTVQQPMWRARSTKATLLPRLSPAFFAEISNEIATRFRKLGVIYVPQPLETLNEQALTRDAYSKAHQLGQAADPDHDHAHMGLLYGELILARLREVLQSHAKGAA